MRRPRSEREWECGARSGNSQSTRQWQFQQRSNYTWLLAYRLQWIL